MFLKDFGTFRNGSKRTIYMDIVNKYAIQDVFEKIVKEDRNFTPYITIAKNLTEMASIKVPIICVVIGEGGSGGALGIGVGDRILMLSNAIYSVISPEGCASILWRDAKFAPDAAQALNLTADALLRLGVIDEINIHIAEPPPPNSLFIPNAFSPDGDGLNDQFIPVFKEELPEQYSLVIYNRWGQEIFDSTNPAEGWDGRVHQKDCPGDIYVYLVKYSRTDQNLSPGTIVKKGTLMLVR